MSGYIDFAIDPATNDIAYENGRMKYVRNENEVVQRVRTCLRRIKGEWFLAEDAGVPYFDGRILGSKDTETVKLILRNEIMDVEGVDSIVKMNVILNPETKHAMLYAEIKIDENIYKISDEL